MSALQPLTLDILQAAVAGETAAIRVVTRLQPAGGPGDKVFPPTYAQDDKKASRYAFETRRLNGGDVHVVLLDSVASQANRLEEALLDAWDEGRVDFPVIGVDFSGEPGIEDLDRITTLDAPHRIADALLRDSVTSEGVLFRDTPEGRAYTEATPSSATAVYRLCPTALVLGVWNSTGLDGGMGAKFQRTLVSEIVGFGAQEGVATRSRLDPVGIEANVKVYHHKDDPKHWTLEESEAQSDEKGKPKLFSRKKADGKGNPSAVNHSNVTPSFGQQPGGVTLDYAQQTTVLSLPALRRLRFQEDVDGNRLERAARGKAELAARTALAALALAGVALARTRGFDLRSRSLLVPEPGGPLVLELLPSDGGEPSRYALPAEAALGLLAAAAKRAAGVGFGWQREPMRLRPAPKLADLIRKSREVAGEVEQDD